MAANNSLMILAAKFSLNNQENILRKAAENLRLLNAKSTAGNNMTDASKTVICLDLAASMLGGHVDQKLAVRYSGLKAPTYINFKKVVENLLEINNEQISVAALCLSLQCNGAQSSAQRLLERYRKASPNVIDLTLPQYVCMAVYHACRLNKIKISKKSLIEKSRLRPAQWSKLESDFNHFINEKFAIVEEKRKGSHSAASDDDHLMDEVLKQEEHSDLKSEDYEEWKRRMLFEAYEELKELEKKESQKDKKESQKENNIGLSPRRSPRKSSQKYSPYKPSASPRKGAGIRLLFP